MLFWMGSVLCVSVMLFMYRLGHWQGWNNAIKDLDQYFSYGYRASRREKNAFKYKF